MNIEFHPEAAEEFEAAVDWYEVREIGLGLDFAAEIHAAIHRAAAMPDAWARLSGDVRRVLLNRFRWCSVRIDQRAPARAGRDALAT
jgi:hypothetical protein